MGIEATGAQQEVNGTKYLSYDPWWGDLNNVRLCIENVAVLAYMLDRTLIISPRHRQAGESEHDAKGDYRPLHPRHFLDLDGIRAVMMPNGSLDGLSTYTVPHFEPDTTVLALCEPGKDIAAFAGRRSVIRLPKEAKDADIISLPRLLTPFYAQLYAGPTTRRAMAIYVKNWVRHYRYAETIARRIAKTLQEPINTIVVRRNEFITASAYPQADIAIDQIESVIAERAPAGSLLVIATDETNRQFFVPLARRYRCLFARDLVAPACAPHFTKWQLSCVEQNLCALGQSYVGTRLSTFSAYIDRIRQYFGAADQDIRFTDRSHHDIIDDAGSPAFSWQATMERGQPLWAREFRIQ